MFIGSCAGNFYAINKTTGQVQWSYDIRKDGKQQSFHGDPLVTDDLILIGTDYSCAPDGIGHIQRLKTETGAVISELSTEAKPVGRLAFADDSLFVFLENAAERVSYIISVDSKLAGVRWKQRSSPDWASERPHLWKESVVAGNCRGGMAAFRATDGEPQWNLSLKGCIRSIGSFGDMLFAGVQEGTIYAYDLSARP